MALYDFKCGNKDCSEYEKVVTKNIPIKDYHVPDCEKCKNR